MAWSIGNSKSGTTAPATAGTTVTLTAPTGIADGTLLFAAVGVDIPAGGDPGAAAMANAGAGASWGSPLTSHFTPAAFKGSLRLTTFQKIAASESGNYTASWSVAGNCSWAIVAITGNASSNPVDATATSNDPSGNSRTLIAPALTGLAGSGDLELCVFCGEGGSNPYTLASGLTTVVDNGAGPGGINSDFVYLSIGSVILTSNANTPTYTTASSFGAINENMSVAFLAGASGGGASGDDGSGRGGAMQSIILMREALREVSRRILLPRPRFAT